MFKRGGGISCEGEVDSRRVAYRCLKWCGLIILGGVAYICLKGGIFWEGWLDSGRIAKYV